MFVQRRRRRNTPACPACGRRMTFVRGIEDQSIPDLHIFECKRCSLTYTVEAEAESEEQNAEERS